MGKIESLALLVAVVGVGMAVFFTRSSNAYAFQKTQYGTNWADGTDSVENLGVMDGRIRYL